MSRRRDLLINVIVPIGVLGLLTGLFFVTDLSSDTASSPLGPSSSSSSFHCARGLTYQQNSCYIDSVLVALFAIPNNMTKYQILEKDLNQLATGDIKLFTECVQNRAADIQVRKNIQHVLVKIVNGMRSGKSQTCINLRKALSHCTKAPEMFGAHEKQDAGEFLTYLLNLFQVDVATRMITIFAAPWEGGPWHETLSVTHRNESPIINVDVHALVENAPISSYVNSTTITRVKDWAEGTWQKTIQKYVSPYLVINVHRLYPNGEINQTRLVPEQHLRLEDEQSVLDLTAIVIYTGMSHYVCVVRCENMWYSYDDLVFGGHLQFVGTYENMLHMKKANPQRLGVLYIYSTSHFSNVLT